MKKLFQSFQNLRGSYKLDIGRIPQITGCFKSGAMTYRFQFLLGLGKLKIRIISKNITITFVFKCYEEVKAHLKKIIFIFKLNSRKLKLALNCL